MPGVEDNIVTLQALTLVTTLTFIVSLFCRERRETRTLWSIALPAFVVLAEIVILFSSVENPLWINVETIRANFATMTSARVKSGNVRLTWCLCLLVVGYTALSEWRVDSNTGKEFETISLINLIRWDGLEMNGTAVACFRVMLATAVAFSTLGSGLSNQPLIPILFTLSAWVSAILSNWLHVENLQFTLRSSILFRLACFVLACQLFKKLQCRQNRYSTMSRDRHVQFGNANGSALLTLRGRHDQNNTLYVSSNTRNADDSVPPVVK